MLTGGTLSLFEYDHDDLARQVQTGLERLAVSFLRAHGARIRRDLLDFHGHEQIDLEVEHDGHKLVVHQVGRPRGPGVTLAEPTEALEEVFESTFDGRPASQLPADELARWLASLPVGEAPAEEEQAAEDAANPLAAERGSAKPRREQGASFNPFLADQPKQAAANPFAATDKERQRQEVLRRLKGED